MLHSLFLSAFFLLAELTLGWSGLSVDLRLDLVLVTNLFLASHHALIMSNDGAQ